MNGHLLDSQQEREKGVIKVGVGSFGKDAAQDDEERNKKKLCCLPQESGPCLSSNVADHPLRSATDHCLGEPLPHQLTNQTQAHPLPINL